jgi:pyruvate kinase
VPIVTSDPENFDQMVEATQTVSQTHLGLPKGEKVLITAGIPFGRPGTTNTLKVAVIE